MQMAYLFGARVVRLGGGEGETGGRPDPIADYGNGGMDDAQIGKEKRLIRSEMQIEIE